MLRKIFLMVLGLWVGMCAFSSVASAASQDRIIDVRFGTRDDLTRVVIDSSEPLDYEYFSLATGTMRIVLDMPRLRWSIQGMTSEAGSGKGMGLVTQYRYGHNSASTSRLVLDLQQPAKIVETYNMRPKGEFKFYRTVIDLKPTSLQTFQANAQGFETPKVHSVEYKREKRKPTIVIDAGHGGKDPGALGANNKEKEVNLAAAKELREALLKTGRYNVALTRGGDEFVELEDRVSRARAYEVDLFISLHADAGSKPSTRGASVYTLSSKGEQRAEKQKEINNWIVDVEKDDSRSKEVTDILVDLVKRETKTRSAEFAQILMPSVEAQGWPVLGNAHRSAGFYVLFAPDVPAVLFEMGFLTNPQDEALLTSSSHRKKLIRGIVHAIDTFFADQELYVAQR